MITLLSSSACLRAAHSAISERNKGRFYRIDVQDASHKPSIASTRHLQVPDRIYILEATAVDMNT